MLTAQRACLHERRGIGMRTRPIPGARRLDTMGCWLGPLTICLMEIQLAGVSYALSIALTVCANDEVALQLTAIKQFYDSGVRICLFHFGGEHELGSLRSSRIR